MQDIVAQVTRSWEAKSEDERRAILVIWNLGLIVQGGASLIIDIMMKLWKLTAINRNHHN